MLPTANASLPTQRGCLPEEGLPSPIQPGLGEMKGRRAMWVAEALEGRSQARLCCSAIQGSETWPPSLCRRPACLGQLQHQL